MTTVMQQVNQVQHPIGAETTLAWPEESCSHLQAAQAMRLGQMRNNTQGTLQRGSATKEH